MSKNTPVKKLDYPDIDPKLLSRENQNDTISILKPRTSTPLKRRNLSSRNNMPYQFKEVNFPVIINPLIGVDPDNVDYVFDPTEPNICVNNRLTKLSVNHLHGDEYIEHCPVRDLVKRMRHFDAHTTDILRYQFSFGAVDKDIKIRECMQRELNCLYIKISKHSAQIKFFKQNLL